MKKVSAKERREALRQRQKQNIKDKDKGGLFGKGVLDTSEYEDIQFFQPKKGRNTIDIIPYLVSSDHHPQGLEEGYEDYVLDIWTHRRIGPKEDSFVCLANTFGKPCPICEERKAMESRGDVDEKEINALKPSRRVYYNVIDLNNEDKGIQIFGVSHYLFERELLEEAETVEDEMVTFADREEGRSIQFRASPAKWGKNEYFEFKSFSFVDRDSYEEDILEESYPLDKMLIVPTYEEVQKAFLGMEGVEQEEEEKEEPQRKSRTVKGRKKKEEEEPPWEEEEKEEKKTRTRSRQERPQKGKCPQGYKFGTDCDEYDECAECDLWQECADEQDRLNSQSE